MFDPIIRFVLMTTYNIRGAAKSRDDKGATAVEYGLLVALIAAVIVVAVGLLGGKVNVAFNTIVNALP
jgi:pilus assembly protein Flp/PilA